MRKPTQTQEPPWTLLRLLKWTSDYFKSHDIDDPRAAAEILLAHTLGLTRIDLYLRHDQPMSTEELQRFKPVIKRRVKREPVAYIVGEKEFWSMPFAVTPDVLIPRPETECLVEAALDLLPPARENAIHRIFEPGTGSGAVIVALASERSGHLFFASDRSVRPVTIARRNAAQNGLDGAIRFFAGHWFDACRHSAEFDMILSNPPYIPSGDIPGLQPEIVNFEPKMSLDGGKGGLEAIGHLINAAHRYLMPGGVLLLEIGHDQKEAVGDLIEACGIYEQVEFFKDYSGCDRGVRMIKKMLQSEN